MSAQHSMQKLVGCALAIVILSSLLSVFVHAQARPEQLPPGLQPFTPTRIDWLTLKYQAALRQEELDTAGFELEIANPDAETILIYVRYTPNVNREIMNLSIDTARKVIGITAKHYGWDGWVKIQEDVQLGHVP